MTLTATPDEVAILDAVETTLVGEWSDLLSRGHSPAFVLGLIVQAHHYEPRFGLPMDECERHGCTLLVDEDARDDLGRLYCPDHVHSDDEDAHERRLAAAYAAGADYRPAPPSSYAEVGLRERLFGGAS